MMSFSDQAREKLQQWFQKASDWQKDLFITFWSGAECSQEIIDRTIKIIDQEYLNVAHHVTAKTEFPSDINFTSPQGAIITLKSISDVQGIGALAPQHPLMFKNGLTVVYGENGCGKSSYVRILKAVENPECSNAVLSNVFKEKDLPAQALITFSEDGDEKAVLWNRNQLERHPLQIYDTAVARQFIERENEVVYEPKVLAVITQMASAFEKISQHYREMSDAVSAKLFPALSEIQSHSLLMSFQEISTLPVLEKFLSENSWEDSFEVELKAITQGLEDADPAKSARTLKAQKLFLEDQQRDIIELLSFVDDSAIKKFKEQYQQYLQSRENFENFNSTFNGISSLHGFATDQWKQMWVAALRYIDFVGGNNDGIPVSNTNKCALCQQEVSEDANVRLNQFHQFLHSNVSSELQKNKNAIDAFQKNLEEKVLRRIDLKGIETAMHAHLISEDIVKYYLEIYHTIVRIATWLINYDPVVPELMVNLEAEKIIHTSQEIVESVTQKIKALNDVIGDRNRQIDRKRQLQAIKWIQSIAREKEVFIRLNQVQSKCKTNLLTTLKKDLADILITDAYVSRFNQEMQALDTKRKIKVELVPVSAKRGRAYHQIVLRGVTNKRKTSEILSEGEYRVVSMAAFLADLSSWGRVMPFIFDDPITSLDQKFEERVATRLVQLSTQRQVIVFTHRLAFAQLLDDGVEKYNAYQNTCAIPDYATVSHIELRNDPLGEPTTSPSYITKGISLEKGINNLLNEDVARLKKIENNGEYDLVENLLQSVCSKFRALVEQGVEQTLLSSVVSRFNRNVSTMKLPCLFAITRDDVQLVHDMMTRYSFFEHSQPVETPVSLPSIAELESDMRKMLDWARDFKKRSEVEQSKSKGKVFSSVR